ncbi:hypothetical protein ACFFTN_20530 [Aminobacter aganoensis]|uniref:Uncharacterized protein n=1 Tax=Aminobacter aganoensis TaxID=83264 RepID=A0A7X0CE61_9HYPH|nr:MULTISPECIES: hypothetical protein [Aminobacter]MBB6352361.1 hypothetical protein [Aminobacter aganoensis]
MKSRAVTIGEGAAGASVIFHLANCVWTDVVLTERAAHMVQPSVYDPQGLGLRM